MPSVTMPPHAELLQRSSRSGDLVVASAADNCRFDERTGVDRWQRFAELLASVVGAAAPTWGDWTEAYRLHLDRHCNVARPSVADAFLEVNRPAWLQEIGDNQSLVRVEDLSRALDGSGLDLEGLRDLLRRADGKDGDAQQAVGIFFNVWNERRDARPAFAAFWDEVQEEVAAPDWPHALRDRLGLGHFGYAGGAGQPIALMRYSVLEVRAAQAKTAAGAAFSMPTVLDGGLHEFFYPVPREHQYGSTIHLAPEQAGTLTAEVLHCRIDYERRHLERVGEITLPGGPTGHKLREARDIHLYALQYECDRADFGEPLENR